MLLDRIIRDVFKLYIGFVVRRIDLIGVIFGVSVCVDCVLLLLLMSSRTMMVLLMAVVVVVHGLGICMKSHSCFGRNTVAAKERTEP